MRRLCFHSLSPVTLIPLLMLYFTLHITSYVTHYADCLLLIIGAQSNDCIMLVKKTPDPQVMVTLVSAILYIQCLYDS